MLSALISDADVNCLSIDARAKEVASFRNKCLKTTPDGMPKYTDPGAQITDLLGARVITYLPEAVDRVCDIVIREFEVVNEADKGAETRQRGLFGYASRHFEVRLNPQRRSLREYSKFGGDTFEIQVRTAVQHAWAEFEHDLRYKGDIPRERRAEVDRRFLLAAALIEMADNEFTAIDRMFRDMAQAAPAPEAMSEEAKALDELSVSRTTLLDAASLTACLSRRYPDAPRSKADHYEWMVAVLSRCSLGTVEQLNQALVDVDSEKVAAAMDHKLPAGQIRRLDDDLLVALGERYARASAQGPVNEAGRIDLLRRRRQRLDLAGFRLG